MFDAGTIANVEQIELAGGHAYSLTLDDANVAAGGQLAVLVASTSTYAFHFDGRDETDGGFIVTGSQGDDVIRTGAGDDEIVVTVFNNDGIDHVEAGAGNDIVRIGTSHNDGSGDYIRADTLSGGAGRDTLVVEASAVTFAMREFSAATSDFEVISDTSFFGIFADETANHFDFSGFSSNTDLTVSGMGGDDVIKGPQAQRRQAERQ